MGTRRGTLLERNIRKIFKLAGFKTKHQVRIKGYEIDVLAETDNLKIIIECKHYEHSPIVVRNLIHQWDSKNKEIKADKILLVIYGVEITPYVKTLAKKYDISIWDKKDVEDYLDYVIEHKKEAKTKILKVLKLKLKKKEKVKIEEEEEEDSEESRELKIVKKYKNEINSYNDGQTMFIIGIILCFFIPTILLPIAGIVLIIIGSNKKKEIKEKIPRIEEYVKLKKDLSREGIKFVSDSSKVEEDFEEDEDDEHSEERMEIRRLLMPENTIIFRDLPEEAILDIKILREDCRKAISAFKRVYNSSEEEHYSLSRFEIELNKVSRDFANILGKNNKKYDDFEDQVFEIKRKYANKIKRIIEKYKDD